MPFVCWHLLALRSLEGEEGTPETNVISTIHNQEIPLFHNDDFRSAVLRTTGKSMVGSYILGITASNDGYSFSPNPLINYIPLDHLGTLLRELQIIFGGTDIVCMPLNLYFQ